jgi:DNA-binding XRE family transcriptional regulator
LRSRSASLAKRSSPLKAGKYVPSLLLAFRLAAAFGVRVEDVFQYEGGSPD